MKITRKKLKILLEEVAYDEATDLSKAGSFLKGTVKERATGRIKEKILVLGGSKALRMVAQHAIRMSQEEASKQIVRTAVVRGWDRAATTASIGARGLGPVVGAVSTGGNILLAFQLGYASGTLINSALIGDTETVKGSIHRQAKDKLKLLVGPQGYDLVDDNEFAAAVTKHNSDASKKKFDGLRPQDIDQKRIGYIVTALNGGFGLRQAGKKIPSAIASVYKLFDDGYLDSKSWFSKAAADRKAVIKSSYESIKNAKKAILKDKKAGIYRNKSFTGTSEFKDDDNKYVYMITGKDILPGAKETITNVQIVYSPKDQQGKKISRSKPLNITQEKYPKAHKAIVSMFFKKFDKRFIVNKPQEAIEKQLEEISQIKITKQKLRNIIRKALIVEAPSSNIVKLVDRQGSYYYVLPSEMMQFYDANKKSWKVQPKKFPHEAKIASLKPEMREPIKKMLTMLSKPVWNISAAKKYSHKNLDTVGLGDQASPEREKMIAAVYQPDKKGWAWKPKLRTGWRDQTVQNTKTAKNSWHTVINDDGMPEGCAVDVYDRRYAWNKNTPADQFWICLSIAAEKCGLTITIPSGDPAHVTASDVSSASVPSSIIANQKEIQARLKQDYNKRKKQIT